MIQANNEAAILEAVKSFGPAPGAKKMLNWEFTHAREAIQSGVYINWISTKNGGDCFRIGSESRCMCGHFLKSHDRTLPKKGPVKSSCNKCECKRFSFIPRRPEELGQWWMPRRKGFDINKYRPACKCKHNHEEHNSKPPHKCSGCSCFGFEGDFACISCDGLWEEHETTWETEKERRDNGRATMEDYLPLANNPAV
jgi:hypothetical protein